MSMFISTERTAHVTKNCKGGNLFMTNQLVSYLLMQLSVIQFIIEWMERVNVLLNPGFLLVLLNISSQNHTYICSLECSILRMLLCLEPFVLAPTPHLRQNSKIQDVSQNLCSFVKMISILSKNLFCQIATVLYTSFTLAFFSDFLYQ